LPNTGKRQVLVRCSWRKRRRAGFSLVRLSLHAYIPSDAKWTAVRVWRAAGARCSGAGNVASELNVGLLVRSVRRWLPSRQAPRNRHGRRQIHPAAFPITDALSDNASGAHPLPFSPPCALLAHGSRQAAGRPVLQIKTTIDFGEDGIPLERLSEIAKLLKERDLGTMSKVKPGKAGIRAHPVRPVREPPRAEQSLGGQDGIRPPAQAGRGCAQGRGPLCLWSIHLGDRIGRGRRRMLYVYYRRGVAGWRLRDRRSLGPSARLSPRTERRAGGTAPCRALSIAEPAASRLLLRQP
jgi:hypothetical protein